MSRIGRDPGARWYHERRRQVGRSDRAEDDRWGLFSHELDPDRAGEAYRLLEKRQDEAVQIVFTYE